ncbi:MAG: HMG-box domain-containing protein, partial [Tetragenococcus koreensis]|nr:HMG-box domain-containing protein [Tetragenococcus koreensis]
HAQLALQNMNDQIHQCQCTPSGHVPRPRNAFILYRQHHHSKVVSENPGKTNPEISKIIGEKWRSLPSDEKEYWVKLGDEEKKTHLEKFPDYRYQPRRSNKKGQAQFCPNCKGLKGGSIGGNSGSGDLSNQLHSTASSPVTGGSPSPLPQHRSHSAASSPYQQHAELYFRPPNSVPQQSLLKILGDFWRGFFIKNRWEFRGRREA